MAIKLSNQFKSTGGRAVNVPKPVAPRPSPAPQAPVQAAPSSAMPIDPFYDAAIGSAQLQYNNAQQQAQYQLGQLGPEYGIGINAQGGVYDDPSNPFSRAAGMHTAYVNRQRSNNTSYAARGQLYGTSLQNAQNEAAHQNEIGRDALIRSFTAAQQRIRDTQTGAVSTLADRVAQAQSDSIGRAIANRPDAASVSPASTAAPAPAAPKPSAAKPKTPKRTPTKRPGR